MRFLSLFTFILLLSACGQKGPLFLPESTQLSAIEESATLRAEPLSEKEG